MPRTTTYPASIGAIVDGKSIDRNNGRQIDWASVNASRINATTNKKEIKAFTVMCELASGKVIPRADRTGAETASMILETNAIEDDPTAALSGYGMIIGGSLYENLLPDSTGSPKVLPAAYKTELQTAGVSTGFQFEQYADTRAS